MGWRLEVNVGGRILYSHSYHTIKSAKAALGRTRGATGKIIKS